MLAFSDSLEPRTRGIETGERQIVAAPTDFNALLLQGEECDQGGKRNTAREGGGSDAGKVKER